MASDSDLSPCPRCGMPVYRDDAEAIAVDMETAGKSCAGCGRTFGATFEEDEPE